MALTPVALDEATKLLLDPKLTVNNRARLAAVVLEAACSLSSDTLPRG
jgi:hypothetical protein